MDDLISIIMPVYNADKYIDQSVTSVLEQIYTNFELIIVDDGSTDSSYRACLEFSKKDNRIKVFTKKNGGPASARNFALNKVKGKFIMFLDSDDILDRHILYEFIQSIDNENSEVDFLCCGHYRYLTSRKKTKMSSGNFTGDISNFLDNIDMLLSTDTLQAPWAKLFKNDIITKYNLRFPEDMLFGEDTCFVYQYLSYVKTLKVIENPLYYHRIYDGSLSRRLVQNIIEIYIVLYSKLAELLKTKKISDWEQKISRNFINSIIYGLSDLFKIEYGLDNIKKIDQINKLLCCDLFKRVITKFPIEGIQCKVLFRGIKAQNVKLIFIFFNTKERIRYIRDKLR